MKSQSVNAANVPAPKIAATAIQFMAPSSPPD
jgi:hypothetical protein